jgi:hypothetical protein
MKIRRLFDSDLFIRPIHFCFCLSELLADLFYPGPAGRRPVGPLLCCSAALQLFFMILFCYFVENPMRGICSYFIVANCSYIPPGGSA